LQQLVGEFGKEKPKKGEKVGRSIACESHLESEKEKKAHEGTTEKKGRNNMRSLRVEKGHERSMAGGR